MWARVAVAFTRCRSAQWPPVMRTSPSPSGRSRPVDGTAGAMGSVAVVV